jgi:isopenicillin-N N-acyltransferase-like protein
VTAVEWPDTQARLECMGSRLEAEHGRLTLERAIEILKDHDGYPDSICRHVKEEDHPMDHDTTVASWVVDLTARVASVSAGPPCVNEHVAFTPRFAQAASPAPA